jgi:hypothetical protein
MMIGTAASSAASLTNVVTSALLAAKGKPCNAWPNKAETRSTNRYTAGRSPAFLNGLTTSPPVFKFLSPEAPLPMPFLAVCGYWGACGRFRVSGSVLGCSVAYRAFRGEFGRPWGQWAIGIRCIQKRVTGGALVCASKETSSVTPCGARAIDHWLVAGDQPRKPGLHDQLSLQRTKTMFQ